MRIKSNTGFSIIEVMTALALLMIGLAGIISLQVAAIHWLGQAKHRTIATQVGAMVMENLKSSPIASAVSPSVIAKDGNSVDIVDADSAALLNDTTMADGIMTWHRLKPMTSSGQVYAANNWTGNYFYLVAYGVEWGGTNGSKFLTATGSGNALAKYPEIVPGPREMYIETWVGWVELGDRQTISAVPGPPNVKDYFDYINSTFSSGYPAVFPKHKVVLKTIRRY